jgi:hypothetical protein
MKQYFNDSSHQLTPYEDSALEQFYFYGLKIQNEKEESREALIKHQDKDSKSLASLGDQISFMIFDISEKGVSFCYLNDESCYFSPGHHVGRFSIRFHGKVMEFINAKVVRISKFSDKKLGDGDFLKVALEFETIEEPTLSEFKLFLFEGDSDNIKTDLNLFQSFQELVK